MNEEWTPAVKLSDYPSKNTGNPEEVKLCKSIIRIIPEYIKKNKSKNSCQLPQT